MSETKSDSWWDADAFSRVDKAMSVFNRILIIDHPVWTISLSICFYLAVLLGAGPILGISANYFVLFPVLSFSMVFGLPGGFAAGVLALPANLLLFMLLGHNEYSPASKPIAELSGLFVGSAFGFLSDYFKKLIREMERRKEVERQLRDSVAEKDILLRELQHRVKNNLNLIKGLIQLQRSRSRDPAFREAADQLLSRVYAIALAHDRLFEGESSIELEPYFRTIAENVAAVNPGGSIAVSVSVSPEGFRADKSAALNLGLIVNELALNAAKHAFSASASDADTNSLPADDAFAVTSSDDAAKPVLASDAAAPAVAISFSASGARWLLAVRDNGKGFPPESTFPPSGSGGLGLTLIDAIARRLSGSVSWRSDGGLLFELALPPVK